MFNCVCLYEFHKIHIRGTRHFYFVGALLFRDHVQTHLGALLLGRVLLIGTLRYMYIYSDLKKFNVKIFSISDQLRKRRNFVHLIRKAFKKKTAILCGMSWRTTVMSARMWRWTSTCQRKRSRFHMMSSNGNIFRITGPLCGEFTGHSPQRPMTQSFVVFFDLCLNKRLSKQS